MPSLSDTDEPISRPVHRVNGRVVTRRPDHGARSKSVCPFRFRLAWWSISRESPSQFEQSCENCSKANDRKKKLGRQFLARAKFHHTDYRQSTWIINNTSYNIINNTDKIISFSSVFFLYLEMAIGINTRRWSQIPWDKNVWSWNVKLDNMLKTRVSITWGSVLDTLFCNIWTILDRGKPA